MESIFIALLLIATLFPAPYIFYKRGSNKFLFISSVVGAATVIGILLVIAALPIIILLIFFVPSLEMAGYTDNIEFLINIAQYIQRDYFYLIGVFHIVLSFLIYKRYSFFRENT